VLTEHGCKIAPNTYWAARKRPPSARAIRDAELVVEIRRVFSENLFVYGADKIWTQLNRENVEVGRGRVEGLMRQEGIIGATRGKTFTVTTTSDDRFERPSDLVSREFTAPAPDRLWVADLTYVKTHTGWVYVAFIIDVYSRFIVGWQASRSLRSDLAIDALEMAVFNRRRAGADLSALVHHSDRGVQGGFNRSSQHLEMEVDDGQTARLVGDVDGEAFDAIAGETAGSTVGGACVLGEDRGGVLERGSCAGVWRVGSSRDALVPRAWWHAEHRVERADEPLPVVRGARGDRRVARARAWGSCDCEGDRSGSFDGVA
jgi:putative transposase